MTRRAHVLYVTPVMPSHTGLGMAIRAGVVLQGLARRYDVSLAVVPMFRSLTEELTGPLRDCCLWCDVIRPERKETWRYAPWTLLLPHVADGGAGEAWQTVSAAVARAIERTAPDIVLAFRVDTWPFVGRSDPRSDRATQLWLDLDVIESRLRRRVAALDRRRGWVKEARFEEMIGRRMEEIEARLVCLVDRLFVSSETEVDELRQLIARSGRSEDTVRLLPNALPWREPLDAPDSPWPFTFLFIGLLDFTPNADAVWFFCHEILARLRAGGPGPIRLVVVGAGPAPEGLEKYPEVQMVGEVADVEPYYRQAHAVVVPLRAGGGTRIKIIEAFSVGRPVVSTTVGAEGLAVRHGEHLLLADSPEEFAAACARIMADETLRRELAARAHSLFGERYSIEAVAEALS